ncbi:hypothetical protein [Algoriphagus resistens]|uniref:hypothetical protein n=1 Tax=Algoriphagus resistens TaxID=1750590 RepID=UPI0007168BD0|nr:hypothetical protein [Algoriphagus resistens]
MMKSFSFSALFLLLGFFPNDLLAQYASKKVKSKYEAYTDSIKQVEYNYTFPILGQGVYKKGFDIPYPVGIMANYMWIQQEVVLDNLELGLETDNAEIGLTPVDFIEFGRNVNSASTVNVRPDLWILPFLNVYGVFGYGNSHTKVNITSPVSLQTSVEQSISTAGFGVMSAFGIGPVWMSVDANWTWNKPELLDRAVNVNVLGIRIGRTLTFNAKPDRNFAFWVGGMSAVMASTTEGEIKLIDALPPDVWSRRDEFVGDYWTWYDGLNPTNPVDRAKLEKADEILTPIVDLVENADGQAIVRYSMDKQVKEKWNAVVGMQFQLNKKLMFRTEGGVLGDRRSFLASVNYRFLL